MSTTVARRFGASETWPGSDTAPIMPALGRDTDDSTNATVREPNILGDVNGVVYTLPDAIPPDLETIDAVRVRLRIRHDAAPPFPGFVENFHAVYLTRDAGSTYELVQGGENALPTAKDTETTVLVTISPAPTEAEWPDVELLLQNWIDFTGSGIPDNPL